MKNQSKWLGLGWILSLGLLPSLNAAFSAGSESQLVFGQISIVRKNVFDTGAPLDKKFPYSWANVIHVVTREDTISHDLLFKSGDPYDEYLLKETERLLRKRPIFRYVKLSPQTPKDGRVDIVIQTDDAWSTAPQVSYGLAGGKHSYELGILEHNLLGTGAAAGAFIGRDIDRNIKGLTYDHPNVLGSRLNFFGGYGSDSTGHDVSLKVEKPYYSTLTHHSEGVIVNRSEDQDRLFENGVETATFHHELSHLRLYWSYALRAEQKRIRRVSLAYEYFRDRFSEFNIPSEFGIPQNRIVSPILMGYEYQDTHYIKERGVRTFERDEDINLGWIWKLEAGPSWSAVQATENSVVGRGSAHQVWKWEEGKYLYFDGSAEGRDHKRQIQNGILGAQVLFVHSGWRDGHTASFRSAVDWGKNMDGDAQFLLGGENGLRGYSVRQFSGTKKMLFTLEDRKVVMHDWLNLITWGWAVFADSGGVWKENQSPALRDFRSDVGVGIRFSPTRSTDPALLRTDVAYALNSNNRPSRFVLNIGADISFGERDKRKFDQ